MPSTLINHGYGNAGDDDTDQDGSDDVFYHDGGDDDIDGDSGENIDHNHNGGFPPWPPVETRTLSIAVPSNAIPLKWKWSSARRLNTQMLPIFTRSANCFFVIVV